MSIQIKNFYNYSETSMERSPVVTAKHFGMKKIR